MKVLLLVAVFVVVVAAFDYVPDTYPNLHGTQREPLSRPWAAE